MKFAKPYSPSTTNVLKYAYYQMTGGESNHETKNLNTVIECFYPRSWGM